MIQAFENDVYTFFTNSIQFYSTLLKSTFAVLVSLHTLGELHLSHEMLYYDGKHRFYFVNVFIIFL